MREALQRVLEWCGFTPTHRERLLAARLVQAEKRARFQAAQVARVERLLLFREGLGAGTIETPAIRVALYGEQPDR